MAVPGSIVELTAELTAQLPAQLGGVSLCGHTLESFRRTAPLLRGVSWKDPGTPPTEGLGRVATKDTIEY